MKKIIRAFVFSLVFQFASVDSTTAQTIWNDGVGDWFTAGNWTAGAPPNTAPPDNNTTAEINNGGTAQINAAGAMALRLTLGQAAADSGLVAVGAGGTLQVGQFFTIGNSGTGNLAISGGGDVTSFIATLGSQNGSTGTATLSGAGSTWVNTADFKVGAIGTGTLTISSGGALTTNSDNDHVGNNGTGTVTVDGIGSTWTHNEDMELGNFASGVGTVNVQNNGSWTLTDTLAVGNAGSGTLNILSGGDVSGTDASIGNLAGGTGTATVDGTGSTWTLSGTLDVGFDGNGSVSLTNGGAVTVNGAFARIAAHATSTSSVTVDGAGSTWTIAGELDVAREGIGTLMVQNGGAVNMTGAGRASIGAVAGSTGTATVTGAGSSLTNVGGLFVGQGGTGTLNVLNGATVTNAFAQIGSNAGSTGTATVDGAGSTWTSNGTLIVGNSGTGNLTISHGGHVTSGQALIGGSSSGNGTVIVEDFGSIWDPSTLYVGGDPSGSQGTGLLRLQRNGRVDAPTTVWSTGTLEYGATSIINGTLTFDGGTLRPIEDASFAHDVTLAAGGVIIDSNGFSGQMTGAFTGAGGITKINDGRIEFTNVNNYSGNTNINGGEFIVISETTTPQTNVNPGGLLGGPGGILHSNVFNSGVVSPGPGTQTFTIDGNYTQNSNGTLRTELGGLGMSEHDLLLVSSPGTASLDGTLQLRRVNGYLPAPGDGFTILLAPAGVSGQFATVTSNFPGLIQPEVEYNPTFVEVVFEFSNTFKSQALTFNQRAVAQNLDEASANPLAAALVLFLGNEPLANLPRDYDLIAPEEYAAIYEIGFSRSVVQNNNIQHRLDDIRSGSNGFCGDGFIARTRGRQIDPKGAVIETSSPIMLSTPDQRWGVFVNGLGDFVSVNNGDANARGYDITSGNVTAGADYRVSSHFAVGVNGGYSTGKADLVNSGRIEVDGGQAGAFATLYGFNIWGSNLHLDGAFNAGWNSYDTRRTGLLGEPVKGDTSGMDWNALIAYGGDWKFGCLLVGTWSTLQYNNVEIDGFTERGSIAPLHLQSQDEDSLRGTTGVRLAYDVKTNGAIVRPEIRAAWQHEYLNNEYRVDARLASGAGSVFTVHGPKIGRDAALVDAGIAIQWNNRISTYVYYGGVLGRENYNNHGVSGGVRFGF